MHLTIEISKQDLSRISEEYNGTYFSLLVEDGKAIRQIGWLTVAEDRTQYGSEKARAKAIKKREQLEKKISNSSIREIEVEVISTNFVKFRVIKIEPSPKNV